MSDDKQVPPGMEAGETSLDELLPVVYQQLRELAAQKLAREKPGQTLQPTALVHEAFIRLMGSQKALRWDDPQHFFNVAAETMRRILVDNARRKRAKKNGGDRHRATLSDLAQPNPLDWDILALHEALERLERHAPRKAALVKLKYFAGLTLEQAAEVLQIARSTADRDWAYAKSWLRVALTKNKEPPKSDNRT